MRAIQWQKTRAQAEALLVRIDADAIAARQQRARIARAKAERLLEQLSDAELRARFRRADADATEWPGLKSEYDKESGKVEFLAGPLKLQVAEGKTPAAKGEKTTVSHPERAYATEFWLHRPGQGHGSMLPGFHEKFGKAPVLAKTLDGRLHLLDGHHSVFYHLHAGKRALSAFVFEIPTAIFQDGDGRGAARKDHRCRAP